MRPHPRALFSAVSHSSSVRGGSPSCSTTVTSLPPLPFRSSRTTARAGPLAGGGARSGPRGNSPSVSFSAPNGLWNGFFSSSGGIVAPGPARGEEGIAPFPVREGAEEPARVADQVGMVPLESARDLVVLLGADGAGRVHETASGRDEGEGGFEDLALEPRERLEALLANAEADIRSAAEDAQFRAGRVDEHHVGSQAGGGTRRDLDARPGAPRASSEPLQPRGIGIASDEPAFAAQIAGESQGLATGSCASVENGFAGTRVAQGRDELAALVLHL